MNSVPSATVPGAVYFSFETTPSTSSGSGQNSTGGTGSGSSGTGSADAATESALEAVEKLIQQLNVDRNRVVVEVVQDGRVHVRIDPPVAGSQDTASPDDVVKSIQTFIENNPSTAAVLGIRPDSVIVKQPTVAHTAITVSAVFKPEHTLPAIMIGILAFVWIFGIVVINSLVSRVSAVKTLDAPVYHAFQLDPLTPLSKRLKANVRNNLLWLSAFVHRTHVEESVFSPVLRWTTYLASLLLSFAACALMVHAHVTTAGATDAGNTGTYSVISGVVLACFCAIFAALYSRDAIVTVPRRLIVLNLTLTLLVLGSIATILICAVRFHILPAVDANGEIPVHDETAISESWLVASIGGMLLSAFVWEPIGVVIATFILGAWKANYPDEPSTDDVPKAEAVLPTGGATNRASSRYLSSTVDGNNDDPLAFPVPGTTRKSSTETARRALPLRQASTQQSQGDSTLLSVSSPFDFFSNDGPTIPASPQFARRKSGSFVVDFATNSVPGRVAKSDVVIESERADADDEFSSTSDVSLPAQNSSTHENQLHFPSLDDVPSRGLSHASSSSSLSTSESRSSYAPRSLPPLHPGKGPKRQNESAAQGKGTTAANASSEVFFPTFD